MRQTWTTGAWTCWPIRCLSMPAALDRRGGFQHVQMPGLRVSCRQCSAFRSHNAHLSEGVPSRCIRWWSSTWRSAPCLQQSRQCSTSSRPTRPSLPPPEHRHLPPGQQPRHQVPPCGRSLALKRPNESCSLLIMRCLAVGLLRSTIVSNGGLGAHAPGSCRGAKEDPKQACLA